jgi:hypothetical protein
VPQLKVRMPPGLRLLAHLAVTVTTVGQNFCEIFTIGTGD